MVSWWALGARQALSFRAPVHFLAWLPCLGKRWRSRQNSIGQSRGSPSPLHQGSSSCFFDLGTLSVGAMCSILGKNWWERVAVAGAVALLEHSLPLLAALLPGLTAAAAVAEGLAGCCYPWFPAAAPGGRWLEATELN